MEIIYAEAQPGKVVLKENDREVLVYPSQYYRLELNTARMLTELNIRYPQNEQMMERRIAQIEKESMDMLLQPVVENAIKHGLREKSGKEPLQFEYHEMKIFWRSLLWTMASVWMKIRSDRCQDV